MATNEKLIPKKYQLINDICNEIDCKKTKCYKKMKRYKKLDNCSDVAVNVCNALSVSSMVITIALIPGSPPSLVSLSIGTGCTALSSILTVLKRTFDYKRKYESSKTTYNQLSDLHRDLKTALVKNNLDTDDIQNLLNDCNIRLSLIEDTSLPI